VDLGREEAVETGGWMMDPKCYGKNHEKDLLFGKPTRCGSMKERNHFPTIDSNTLAMVGRSDMGLREL